MSAVWRRRSLHVYIVLFIVVKKRTTRTAEDTRTGNLYGFRDLHLKAFKGLSGDLHICLSLSVTSLLTRHTTQRRTNSTSLIYNYGLAARAGLTVKARVAHTRSRWKISAANPPCALQARA